MSMRLKTSQRKVRRNWNSRHGREHEQRICLFLLYTSHKRCRLFITKVREREKSVGRRRTVRFLRNFINGPVEGQIIRLKIFKNFTKCQKNYIQSYFMLQFSIISFISANMKLKLSIFQGAFEWKENKMGMCDSRQLIFRIFPHFAKLIFRCYPLMFFKPLSPS